MTGSSKLKRPEDQESVPEFIRRLISETGDTQTEFAKRVRLARQTINSIVNGATEISPATAHTLQAALKCDGRYLLILQAKAAFKAAAAQPIVKRKKLEKKPVDKSEPLVPASVVKKVPKQRKLEEIQERQERQERQKRRQSAPRRARTKVQKS